MKDYNVKIQPVEVSNHKFLGVVDRVCLTIRQLINKYKTVYWCLDKLVNNYNTYNSTIKYKPKNPNIENIKRICIRNASATEQNSKFAIC